MGREDKTPKLPLTGGYQPKDEQRSYQGIVRKGYQPEAGYQPGGAGQLDPNNPPTGGSGVVQPVQQNDTPRQAAPGKPSE